MAGPKEVSAALIASLAKLAPQSSIGAADCAAFARALSEHFAVHNIERRGRGESGPQGEDYSIVKECEDVLALQAKTGASLLVGHSYGGLVALVSFEAVKKGGTRPLNSGSVGLTEW